MKILKNIAIIIVFILSLVPCIICLHSLFCYAILKDMDYFTIYNNVKEAVPYCGTIILTFLGFGAMNIFRK